MDATTKVRTALNLERKAHSIADEWQKPRVDAKIAILNADLNDRERGITGPKDKSNGLTIAEAVLTAAGVA